MSPTLFLNIASTEARKLMSYRTDFWLNSVVGLIAGILIPYFLWSAIFAEAGTDRIGGFTFGGLLAYYVVAVLLSRIVQGPDLTQSLAQDIYQGELSRYLVYPTRYLAFKYAQHLGFTSTAVLQMALFAVAFALILDIPAETAITPLSVLRCAISVAVGNLLYFLCLYPIQAVAFWADNIWSLAVLLRFVAMLLGGLFLPLDLFPEAARELVMFTPFPYLYWFPVNALTGGITPGEWWLGLGIALAWVAAILWVGQRVWNRGQLRYTGVGI